jgi:hypothetical protein
MKPYENIDSNTLYDDYLYNSPEKEKVLLKIKNELYIKYPKIEKPNKEILEFKYEKRILLQDELDYLFSEIKEYNKLPLYRRIVNKLKFICRNIGQWKIVLYINNVEYKIFFIGIKMTNFNSKYCKYLHEAMPDNYKIIKGEDILSEKEIKSILKIERNSTMTYKSDILEIERNILLDLDNLDNLLNEYEELCNKLNGTFSLKNWMRKKFLIKDIKMEIHILSGNIQLLLDIQVEQILKLAEKEVFDSNSNLEVIAEKLTRIAPKYSILRKILGINGKTRVYDITWVSWKLIPYYLWDQYLLTEQYNEKFASNNINFQVKSILTEIIKKCKLAGLDYDMFLTRIGLYEEYRKGASDDG